MKMTKKELGQAVSQTKAMNPDCISRLACLNGIELGSYSKVLDLENLLNEFQLNSDKLEKTLTNQLAIMEILEKVYNVKKIPMIDGAYVNMIKQAKKSNAFKLATITKDSSPSLQITPEQIELLLKSLPESKHAITNNP